MPQFQCWSPEDEDAPPVVEHDFAYHRADYADEAAMAFAQEYYDDGDIDTPHDFPLRVNVRERKTGDVTEHIVEIDFEPTFTSRLTRECADRVYQTEPTT